VSKLLLTIELVPLTSWLNNVRDILTKSQWDNLKSKVASQAYYQCEICGDVGPRHPVECHEIWSYDSKKFIQNLKGLIALCPNCHMVKHMGLARVQGKEELAIKHFMKVNKLNRKQAELHIQKAFETWAERSQKEWKLNIDHLSEYGLDVSKLNKEK
jgi:hypothetical protein